MNRWFVNILLLTIFVLSAPPMAYGTGFKYDGKGRRDPLEELVTRDGRILPGAKAGFDTDSIVLEGVIWDPSGRSLAIINGKPVREQEAVYGLEVLRINRDSVVLNKDGKTLKIELRKKGGGENGF